MIARRPAYTLLVRGAILAAIVLALAAEGERRLGETYAQIFCTKFSMDSSEVPAEIRAKLDNAMPREGTDAAGRKWRVTGRGLSRRTAARQEIKLAGRDGLPVLALHGIVRGPDGPLWIGTAEGAMAFTPDAGAETRWRYFWGERYLPSNDVRSIVAEKHRAWIRTSDGISLIEFRPYGLEQKAEFFLRRLRERHLRYGFVNDCVLERAGEVASCHLKPSDNDGLWTAIYVAAECFRYGATKTPEALTDAREALAALERLENITGIPGFPARAISRRGEPRDQEGEWHWTADREWEWKGDTSSDELAGHFFAYTVAYDLLPDEADRAGVGAQAGRIATHLLDHGLKLAGFGGRVTRWGDYSPEYFHTREGREEAPLSSLEILSHLRVAYHVTGEAKFIKAYRHLATELGYAENVRRFATETPAEINYSDEELAYLAFYPLMILEDDPALKADYRGALEGLWRRTRDEQNPLWDFIYGAVSGSGDYDRDGAVRALERIPMDTITWRVENSCRVDLEVLKARGRFGERQARRAIPPDQRAVMKWNGNPFELDGGDGGRYEDDGAFFLLPYWLARHHRL